MNVLLVIILSLAATWVFTTAALILLGVAGMVAPFIGMSPLALQWMAGITYFISVVLTFTNGLKK